MTAIVRRPVATRAVGLAGAAALLVGVAACSSSKSAGTAKTSGGAATSGAGSTGAGSGGASSPATTDYKSLLIAASDIPVPGFTQGAVSAPPQGAGATASYTDSGGARTLGDTIVVLPDAAAAKSARDASIQAAKAALTKPEVTDAPVGDGGTALRGTSGQGAVAIVIFTEGAAEVVLEFVSAANDPVPTSVVQQVATKQDELIKNGLPG